MITIENENIEEKYKAIIIKIAKQFSNNIDFQNDLIQEGYVGLLMAKKNYDPNVGVKFLTYAYPYIKSHILRYYNLNKKNECETLSENEIKTDYELDNICFDNIESILEDCSDDSKKIINAMVDGYSIREIAENMGYPKSKVSYILSKEKDKLYKKIKNI